MLYRPQDVITLAKPYDNTKPDYVFVNPLLAKYQPVSPSTALTLMDALGSQLYEKHADSNLIIGLSETATALATTAAMHYRDTAYFLNTTQDILHHRNLTFSDTQKLYLPNYPPVTNKIILIDDVIFDENRLWDIIYTIRKKYPAYKNTSFIAASIVNAISDKEIQILQKENITCEYLCKIKPIQHAPKLPSYMAARPTPLTTGTTSNYTKLIMDYPMPDNRRPHHCTVCNMTYHGGIQLIWQKLKEHLPEHANIRIIGTEAYLYLAIQVGKMLENNGFSVRCHATTQLHLRTCHLLDYPLHNGCAIQSFYDENKASYLYNIDTDDDIIIIITNSTNDNAAETAMSQLCQAFPETQRILIQTNKSF